MPTSLLRSIVLAAALAGFASTACAAPAIERWAIVGARVYPGPHEAPIDDAIILIDDGLITAVAPRASLPVPAGYRLETRQGQFVLAGFWNSHIHLTRPAFLNLPGTDDPVLQSEITKDFTAWGFATIVDLASTTAIAGEVKQRIASGRIRGPRLLSAGDPFYPPGATPIYARPLYEHYRLPSAEITSAPQATARAKGQLAAGLDLIKLFTGSIQGGADQTAHMDVTAVEAIVQVAHAHGRPVFAHPTDAAGLAAAVDGGVDVLAHASPLMGPWSDAQARRIASRGVALAPTLALFAEAANPDTPVEVAIQQTSALAAAGGDILFGTDAGFTDQFDTTNELRLMAQALGFDGLLAALTTTPAKVFGEGARRGRVAQGMIADLTILSADPRRDVAAMARVEAVVIAGELAYTRPPPAR